MALDGQAFEALAGLAKQMREEKPEKLFAEIERALAASDCAKAQRLCAAMRKKRSKPIAALCILSAQAALGVGDVAQAKEETHKALQLEPQSTTALRILADLTFAAGEEPIAMVYYQQVQENLGSSAVISVDLASLQTKTLKRRYLALRNRVKSVTDEPELSVSKTKESTTIVSKTKEQVLQVEPTPSGRAETGEKSDSKFVPELGKIDEIDKTISAVDLPSIEVREEPASELEVEKVEKVQKSEAKSSAQSLRFSRPMELESGLVGTGGAFSAPTSAKDMSRYDRMKFHPVFQTETMARMLIAQGHKQAALDLIDRLVVREDTESGRMSLESLREGLREGSREN